MPQWKTSKTFIKNIVNEAWGQDEIEPYTKDDNSIKIEIESLKEELWHEGYIDLVNAHWKERDYEKIRQAANARMAELNELDE